MFKKKRLAIIVAVITALFAIALFAACGSKEVKDVKIVVIAADGETLVSIEARDYGSKIVIDILTENNEKLQIPQAQLEAGFITTVAGITAVWGDPGSEWWWRFEVNGAQAPLGIRDMRVGNGAVISFKLVEGWSE